MKIYYVLQLQRYLPLLRYKITLLLIHLQTDRQPPNFRRAADPNPPNPSFCEHGGVTFDVSHVIL